MLRFEAYYPWVENSVPPQTQSPQPSLPLPVAGCSHPELSGVGGPGCSACPLPLSLPLPAYLWQREGLPPCSGPGCPSGRLPPCFGCRGEVFSGSQALPSVRAGCRVAVFRGPPAAANTWRRAASAPPRPPEPAGFSSSPRSPPSFPASRGRLTGCAVAAPRNLGQGPVGVVLGEPPVVDSDSGVLGEKDGSRPGEL